MRLTKIRGREKVILISLFAAICVIATIFKLYEQSKRLNVILISLDALRSDHLRCYGYKRDTSPNIDCIAQDGVLFTQSIAQSPRTPTSIAAIMTSTMPNKHLFLQLRVPSLNPKLSTLAEILKSHGYQTLMLIHPNKIEYPDVKKVKLLFDGVLRGFDEIYAGANSTEVTDKMIQFIGKNVGKRFFIWAHYLTTHAPYSSSKAYY